MKPDQVLLELMDKWGEHIEQASPYEDLLVIHLLCQTVSYNCEEIDRLKKRIEYLEHQGAKS